MIKERSFLLLLTFALVSLLVSCGNASDHDDNDSLGGGPVLTGIQLIFQSANAGQGDVLHCDAPGLPWDPGIAFNQNNRAVINNAQPGTYTCNIELQSGSWVVYSPTEHLFGPTVTSQEGTTVLSTYIITEGDIVANGLGGGNWQLWLSDGGTVTGPGGGGTVDPGCVNPVPTIDVEVVIKDYSGGFSFTPFVYFTSDGWNPRAMTMVTANMYSYTFSNVPTDQLHTVNFKDNPANPNYLFDQSGSTGDYIVLVNGVQVNQMLDDDIRVLLFRNVRELLINVIKHAEANKVKVSISRDNDYIKVRVEDNGVGFNPVEVTAMAAKRAEFGLFSIRERLEQLGGMIEIDSEPGSGSKITMRAPLKINNSTDR